MADFKTALAALSRGDLSYEKVTANIDRLLAQRPAIASEILRQLREAFAANLTDETNYARLKKHVIDTAPNTSSITDSHTPATTSDAEAIPSSEMHADTWLLEAFTNPTDSNSIDLDLSGEDQIAALEPDSEDAPTYNATQVFEIAPGTILKQRFQLDEVIGTGGMGTVYKSRDLIKVEAHDKNPYVAVKVLNEDFKKHPNSFIALQREASRQQRLAHPNIATVYDFDRTTNGVVFITMELLIGKPLNTYIGEHVKPRGGLPFPEAFPIIEGLANALTYAHERNIVHSDFKPANGYLTENSVVKVLDFGIARAISMPDQTSTDKTYFDPSKLGALTPAYASPEMLDAQEPDPRDDIYALACVSYELLSGKHPFNKTPATTARENSLVPAPIPHLKRRQMRALRRGLAFERKERTETVAQFLRELEARTSPLRNPMILAPALLILLGLVAMLPALDWWHQREIDKLIAAARGSTPAHMDTVLAKLSELDDADRDQVLVAAREPILKAYTERITTRIDTANGQYDFAGAREMIADLTRFDFFKDSAQVKTLAADVDKQENLFLAQQTTLFNQALAQKALLPLDDALDIHDPLKVLTQISPDVATTLKKRLPSVYGKHIERARNSENFEHGLALTKAATNLIGEDEYIKDLEFKLTLAQEHAAERDEIARLVERLGELLAHGNSLSQFTGTEDDIAKLVRLAPDHAFVAQLRARVSTLVSAQLNAADSNSKTAADDLLQYDFGLLLRTLSLYEFDSRNRIARDEFLTELQNRADAVLSSLASDDGERAIRVYEELRNIAPHNALTNDVARVLAHTHLKDARRARQRAEFDVAIRALAEIEELDRRSGVAINAEFVQAERARINADRLLRPDEREAQTSERARESDKLLSDLATTLAGPTSVETFANAVQLFDRAEAFEPGNERLEVVRKQFVTSAIQQMAERVSRGAWDDALRVGWSTLAIAPRSTRLRERLQAIATEQRAARIATMERFISARKHELETVLAHPNRDRAWYTKVQDLLADIIALAGGNDPWVDETRTALARHYLADADEMRTTGRFEAAAELLQLARRYDPSLDEIETQQRSIDEALIRRENELKEQAQAAHVASLKQSFDVELRANQVENAEVTFTELKAVLGDEDHFIAAVAPQRLARMYVRLATAAAARQDFSAADKFARKGANLDPGNEDLRLAVRDYRIEANIQLLDRQLHDDNSFDLDNVLEKIAVVQQQRPKRYASHEQRWGSAIAKRLEQLQQSGNTNTATLLQKAQALFPANKTIAKLAAPMNAEAIDAAIERGLLTRARTLLQTTPRGDADHPAMVRLNRRYENQLREAKSLFEGYKRAFQSKDFMRANDLADRMLAVWSDSDTFHKEKKRVLAALNPARALSTPRRRVRSKQACDMTLAGLGKRQQGTCYDMLSETARGPQIVVVPKGPDMTPFGIGKFEVSQRDFEVYCELSRACEFTPSGASNTPLREVSLSQIKAYLAWVSAATERVYRLPTSREWEYAAHADGQQPRPDYNCRIAQGNEILKGAGVVAIDSGKANGWGLYNYIGNVQELVADRDRLRARGGGFDDPYAACSLDRDVSHTGLPDPKTGFRVLLELH